MAINVLDDLIINRISAGEVVESPFSIVKELLDNSIDAGATKITVEIKNGGIDQIVIKDNGKGIEKDDLVKAFLPHATSKIKDITDLDSIATLGFRGEALASISNVSKTTLTSKTADGECAYTINVFGGEFGEIEPDECEIGTKIEVNNLFFNTPARRKFLKKPKQEETQITNIITRYMMAHPKISFKYIVNDSVVYYSKGDGLLQTISSVYGDDITQNIMYVEKTIGYLTLKGYVSKVGFSKPNTTYQTLILNNRYIIDEIVSKAVYMAFEEYLMPRQFPFYVFELTMPNVDVDVNVHPSKMNVKFANPSKIYDLVYTTVRAKIYSSLYMANQQSADNVDTIIQSQENNLIKTDVRALQEIEIEPNSFNSVEFSKSANLKQEIYSPITIFDLHKNIDNENANNNKTVNNSEQNSLKNDMADIKPEIAQNVVTESNDIQPKPETNTKVENVANKDYVNVNEFSDYKVVGELFNEFIILEKGDNMLLMDFHAGHERLNYDKFTQIVKNREIVIQDLLVPFIYETTEQEVEHILSYKDDLEKLGFDIDSFGDKKIIINSIPMQLKDINLKNFVEDLLHDIKNGAVKINTEIQQYLMQKACKSSVKSGMTLSKMEIDELLKNLDMNKPVLLCPHGRPVISVITKSQIEKWFKRIV